MKPSAQQRPARKTVALVLAGGRGTRLHALTDHCAKPAVPFGGKFRIIDFVLSNCVNSGINRIGVLTQYKSHALLRHLQHGWSFLRNEANEFIYMLPAQQRADDESWYQGTADAVFQNLDVLRDYEPEYILILAGDHVYKMDYDALIEDHVAQGAACTVACIDVPLSDASAFGVMTINENRRITRFQEKPAHPQPMPGKPGHALASMGVYVFNAAYLYAALQADAKLTNSSHDFGKDLIPALVERGDAVAHPFDLSCVKTASEEESYWRDVGTVDAYWASNIDLCAVTPKLNLYDSDWPIWTYQPTSPPAKFIFDDDGRRGMAVDSMVSGGCIISGAEVRQSVLFTGVHVHSYSSVEQCVVLPKASIGRHSRLRKVIVDEGCQIPPHTTIGYDAVEDARRFHRSPEGVVLVTTSMLEAMASEAKPAAAQSAPSAPKELTA